MSQFFEIQPLQFRNSDDIKYPSLKSFPLQYPGFGFGFGLSCFDLVLCLDDFPSFFSALCSFCIWSICWNWLLFSWIFVSLSWVYRLISFFTLFEIQSFLSLFKVKAAVIWFCSVSGILPLFGSWVHLFTEIFCLNLWISSLSFLSCKKKFKFNSPGIFLALISKFIWVFGESNHGSSERQGKIERRRQNLRDNRHNPRQRRP